MADDIPSSVEKLYEQLNERLLKNGSFTSTDLHEVLSGSGLLPSTTAGPETAVVDPEAQRGQKLRNDVLSQQLEHLTKLTKPIGTTTVSAADAAKPGSFEAFFANPHMARAETDPQHQARVDKEFDVNGDRFASQLAQAASRIGIKEVGETPQERRDVLQALTNDRLSRGRVNEIGKVTGIDFQPSTELMAASAKDPRTDAAFAKGFLTEMNGNLSGADALPRIESLSGRPKTPAKKRNRSSF